VATATVSAAAGPALPARIAVALAVGLGVVLLDQAGGGGADGPSQVLRRLELLTLDWRFRLRGRRPPGPEVALVTVDDRSVAALGRWPPPRDALADAVDRLAAAGARTVVLNLLLSEPAPTLPAVAREALAAALPGLAAAGRPGLADEVEALLGRELADTRLGAAIARAGRVVLPYAFAFDERAANIAGVPPWVAAGAYPAHAARPGAADAAAQAVGEPRGVLTMAPGLASVGAGSGHVNLPVDEDGLLRADLPALAYRGSYYPSLAVEAARVHLGLPRARVVPWLGERLELGPDRALPLDARSRLLVDHRGPEGSFPATSLADLLAGRADPARFRDRLVVLGASAAATGDRFATPFSDALPGSEHVAATIDNLLRGRALRRDGRVRTLDAFATGGLALAGALAAGRRSLPLSLAAAAGLAVLWGALAQLALARWGWWLAAVAPALAALLAAGVAEAVRAGREQRLRRGLERQRANLARYFPPAVVDRLAAAGTGGQVPLERTQRAAVLFVDIVGFTGASEGLPPERAVELLRAFHRLVERAVFAHGGMVDKFMGDGAMACFGVPDPSPAAAADALRAARALLGAIRAWGAELAAAGLPPLRAGVGIHVGPVLIGDIGGERQFQFTVVGDTVNVASRLEALTREVGASLLVSSAVVEEARAAGADLAGLEPLPARQLRGRDGWLTPWRLPAGEEEVERCVVVVPAASARAP
jgi:adenylate cyclase